MNIIDKIKEKAKQNKKRIVLPESMDKRVLSAAVKAKEEDIAEIILIGKREEIISEYPVLASIQIIDPSNSELIERYINNLYEMRKEKGLTIEEARNLLLNDYMYFACMLVIDNKADGIVSGACHSTSNTLRPALQIIKTKENEKMVSAFFLMEVPNCEYGLNGTFIFADSGLNQNPTSSELAYISIQSANSFKKLTESEPYVALLSHSTKGSAKHEDVDKVVNALNIIKELNTEYQIDGELQLDAAIIKEIAETKAPNSPVAGKANVLIFPDLDSGNIGYKLVERLAKANAYGPLTQGMKYPVNDLSRGCSVDDIVGVIAITSIQVEK